MRCSHALLLVLLLAMLAASSVRAQPALATYAVPSEVTALDSLIAELRTGGEEIPAADLVELSRLLSRPCDQLSWLVTQVDAAAQQSGGRQAAWQLGQAIRARWPNDVAATRWADCAGQMQALQDTLANLQPVSGITDPDDLRAWLAQEANPRDVEAGIKFAFLARGLPAARFFSRNQRETWDMPRIVVEQLARDGDLAGSWQLLRLRQLLDEAHAEWRAAQPSPIADAELARQVNASFTVAAALTDRALGLDEQDRQAGAATLTYVAGADAWRAIADGLRAAALPHWEALARVLEASAQPTGAGRQSATDQAAQAWATFRAVNTTSDSAVDDAANGWLARLNDAGRMSEPGRLSLASDYRSASRGQRQGFETQAQQQLAARNANALLQSIQSAKAAEHGLSTNPLSLDQVISELGGEEPWVYLYLEMLELRGGGATQYCGVAVYRKEYTKRMLGRPYTDEYLSAVIPAQATPEAVVAAALALPGFPLRSNGQIRRDARIIIAPDGPLGDSWFDYEAATLLQPTEWTTGSDPSWVVYVPSASALTGGGWTLDSVLRVWYRSALRSGVALDALSTDPKSLAIAGSGPPLDGRDGLSFYVVQLVESRAIVDNRLSDFMQRKRNERLPAIPLGVGAQR
ncbi:MAG: hypothetical protein JXO22_15900 [Phycisphaerae bacterium]|nr:hypothetical protein [Phycisphaerae bacterium]